MEWRKSGFGHSEHSIRLGQDFPDSDFQYFPDSQAVSRNQIPGLRQSASQPSQFPQSPAKLHTVAQSPARRGRVKKSTSVSADVTVHVWKGLSARHVREVAGVPVLMPVPAWSLAAGRWGIQDIVMVAESLIRHRFAARKGLIEFVKLRTSHTGASVWMRWRSCSQAAIPPRRPK